MDLIYEYILFLLKFSTCIIFALLFLIFFVKILKKNKLQNSKLRIIDLSRYYNQTIFQILSRLFNHRLKEYNFKKSILFKNKSTLYVLEFIGDMHASEVSNLRKEISIIISIAKPDDEVLLKLESAGGTVHEYGLAASQLQRLRKKGIKLTVVIDKIAASGGYMMACVANYIYSAPFAIIGSIGVIGQLPNLNKLLKKYNIDFELHTSGSYKRNLTLFGENKDIHRIHFQNKLNSTHQLFKTFVQEMRPVINITEVSNGDYWFGRVALINKLVDEIGTSDDVIVNMMKKFHVIRIYHKKSKGFFTRFTNYFF
ncbi:protease SohB [Buchnera aphidicola]|uniref:protease SohB n=1 Tax=Buchnera aphidicola TaxID=9 RepID=UPI0031B84FD1